MELYTLDEQLRRSDVVEGYESLIWTERYSAWGDFELVFPSTRQARSLLRVGTRLAFSRSHRVMTVETLENTVDAEGVQLLKVTGRSMEAVLDDRVDSTSLAHLEQPNPQTPDNVIALKWDMTELPVAMIYKLFAKVCVDKVFRPGDGIPFYKDG